MEDIQVGNALVSKEQLAIAGYVKDISAIKKNVPWIPFKYEVFYYIDITGQVVNATPNMLETRILEHLIKTCNIFKTEIEATISRGANYAYYRVVRKLRELEGDFVVDLNSLDQRKYHGVYLTKEKKILVTYQYQCQSAKKDWYSSQPAWLWVAENMLEDVKTAMSIACAANE